MHIRFVSIALAAVLALSSVSVQAAPTRLDQGLQNPDKAMKIYDHSSSVTFAKRYHGHDGEDANDEEEEEEEDEHEHEEDEHEEDEHEEDEHEEDEEEKDEKEHHRHHARSIESVANGERVQLEESDIVKRHKHSENEPDENEPDEDENEPDENEPDEDENEPDENEPDEDEPDEDEDEHHHHRHHHV